MALNFPSNPSINDTYTYNRKIYVWNGSTWGVSDTVTDIADPWYRNPSWPACEANAGDNKVVGLYAVWPGDSVGNGGNFFTIYATGNYTVNYGDGTVTNYTSGTVAYYEFDYNNTALNGSDAPVTFTSSSNTVNRTAHGYTNGMTVKFYNIVTTTGIVEEQTYYVINATTNTFQISLTENGTVVPLTNDGSATLLPYKIAVVTVTPQVGQSLPTISFLYKHNQTGLADRYSTGWLDIAIAVPSCTTLDIGSSLATVRHLNLERVRINELGNVTTFYELFCNCHSLKKVEIASTITTVTDTQYMFRSCYSLASVSLFDTSSVQNMSNMFYECYSLTTVPLFNTSSVLSMSNMFLSCYSLLSVPLFDTSSVTNMSTMFYLCSSLRTVPLFNTSSVTNMNSMFNNCTSLDSVPRFDTSSVTNMSYMFAYCYSLVSVPLFDTSSVTSTASMFVSCYALVSVPLFNTSFVTDMNTMFSGCRSLISVPRFDTSSVTNMTSMFSFCYSLVSVPLFDTSAVTSMNSMFTGCVSLITIPPFNTSAVTNMRSMFSGCYLLANVPAFDTSAVTTFSSMFNNCNNLSRIEASNFNFTFSVANCKLSSVALDEIYTNLPTVTGQTITVSGNYGVSGDDPTIATAKGWTVTG